MVSISIPEQPAPRRAMTVWELPLAAFTPEAERRFVPRVVHAFRVVDAASGTTFEGRDLSFGGFFCVGDVVVWPGTELRLNLHLGDGPALEARSEVAALLDDRGKPGMRMRFVFMSAGHRRRLAQWMAARRG